MRIMTLNTAKVKNIDLLYPKLSYQIQGAAIDVRKHYGPGHKEVLYQRVFAEELSFRKVKFEKEKPIKIYSYLTSKVIASYQPDFIVDNKIIVEIKALNIIPRKLINQLYDYLRNSNYELGYFINFSGPKLYMKRIIYSNINKSRFKNESK